LFASLQITAVADAVILLILELFFGLRDLNQEFSQVRIADFFFGIEYDIRVFFSVNS
jgi:hypothetical protein